MRPKLGTFKGMLEVEHADPELATLEADPSRDSGFDGGTAKGIAKRFRATMQIIRTVSKINKLHQYNGLRYHRVPGSNTEWGLRLNQKWRLIVEPSGEETENEKMRILRIDNHYGDN